MFSIIGNLIIKNFIEYFSKIFILKRCSKFSYRKFLQNFLIDFVQEISYLKFLQKCHFKSFSKYFLLKTLKNYKENLPVSPICHINIVKIV